jgi:hypothetical protein
MRRQIIRSIDLMSSMHEVGDIIRKDMEGYEAEVEQMQLVLHAPAVGKVSGIIVYREIEKEIAPSPRINYAEEREKKTVEEKPKKKTYMEDFFEKFPNAPRDPESGEPQVCPNNIYAGAKDGCACGCVECWNREMEE